MSGRKRKHGASPNPGDLDHRTLHPIQAYEADIRCSQTSARSLEASDPHIGEALIKHSTGGSEIWLDRYVRSTLPLQNPVCSVCSGTVTDIHLIFTFGTLTHPQFARYDVRLILNSPSTYQGTGGRRSQSPSGWSDIPSDTEDTFFFCQEEAEDYRRDKRRRLMESAREERLRALELLEPTDEPQETCWASDEEPDKVQKDLMERTALHIQSSPNPAQLEMRILANHGADHRFAFLRGRWPRHWTAMTDHARTEILKRDRPAGLGGLAGYGSDDDSDAENGAQG